MIPATFDLAVDGVGSFTFRKRTMRDQLWIECEATRIHGGGHNDAGVSAAALHLATLRRLVVSHPEGWDTRIEEKRASATVDGVGEFTFRSSQPDDMVWIEAEALRIAGGAHESVGLDFFCLQFAALIRLVVKAPDGFSIDALDPLSDDDVGMVGRIYAALRGLDLGNPRSVMGGVVAVGGALADQEARFRQQRGQERPAGGARDDDHGRVPLSAPLPASAD